MTIRLLVLSTAPNTNRILAEMKRQAAGALDVVLHFGDKRAHYKASSLSRMKPTTGARGHLLDGSAHEGAGTRILEADDYFRWRDLFCEHMTRTHDLFKYKSHPLTSPAEHHAYYHILCDAVAARIRASGATHCLFFNAPHLAYDTIIYQIARSMGLPITIVGQSIFPGKFFSARDPAHYGAFRPSPDAPPFAIEKGTRPDLFYMKGIKQEREAGGRITGKALLNLATHIALKRPAGALDPAYLFRTIARMRRIYAAFPKWRDPLGRYMHDNELDYFERLAGYEDQSVDLSGDFVYFPLQLQPEMTTATLGGRFRDQAHAIERLSGILPAGVRILVKENPKQGAYCRGPLFFERLRRIPSVTLLPSWANTHALTDGAKFVAAITGTVGWEAIRAGKPAVVFGAAWYRRLPGVYEFSDDLGYDRIVSTPIDHGNLERAIGALLHQSHDGVVDRHYTRLVPAFDPADNDPRVARQILALLRGEAPCLFGPQGPGEGASDVAPGFRVSP